MISIVGDFAIGRVSLLPVSRVIDATDRHNCSHRDRIVHRTYYKRDRRQFATPGKSTRNAIIAIIALGTVPSIAVVIEAGEAEDRICPIRRSGEAEPRRVGSVNAAMIAPDGATETSGPQRRLARRQAAW